MNKTKMTLAATGGTLALGVLVMAFFTWSAFSEKAAAIEGDDENEGLASVVGRVKALKRKRPYPSSANCKQVRKNAEMLQSWCEGVRRTAALGDWCVDETCTPATFKEQVGREAKMLLARQGKDETPFLKPDFSFGPFREYLGDKMPLKNQLDQLQRQWHDIRSLLDLLATNGVLRVDDVQLVEKKADIPAKEVRKPGKKVAKKEAKTARPPSVETYRLAFQCNPEALVNVIRELSFQKRFTVVDDLAFSRVRDTIADSLGTAEKKKDAAAQSAVRRRRRGAAAKAAKEAKEEQQKDARGTLVFDPAEDSVLAAEVKVSVYDFRSLEPDEKGDAE